MVQDFITAALPWIAIALFVAVACAFMGSMKRK